MKKTYSSILFFCSFFSASAQNLFTQIPGAISGIHFNNLIYDTKALNVLSYAYLYNGGGVTIGDINNDNLPDIYFSGNFVSNKLYLNKGNFKFEDITVTSGTTGGVGFRTGVSMVDINNDGFLDIYVCKSVSTDPKFRENILYINNGNNTFTDKAASYGLNDASFSTQAYFYDMDLDGDIDMFLLNHPLKMGEANIIKLGYNDKNVLAPIKDSSRQYCSFRYYLNENGKFSDHTIEAGLGTYAYGLSAIIDDFNNDGYPDIYTSNDYIEPDYLFVNNKNGTFTDKNNTIFKHTSSNAMGSDYADINNDGLLDFMSVDMLPPDLHRQKQLKGPDLFDQNFKKSDNGFGFQFVKNTLQLNNGNNTYSDISYLAGVAYSDWSWAPLIADFDNDGNKDIYISKGYIRDVTDLDFAKYGVDSVNKAIEKLDKDQDIMQLLSVIPTVKAPNYFFKNNGNLTFTNQAFNNGLQKPCWSNGAAYGDLDSDGDLDLVLNTIFDTAFVYKNNSVENKAANYLRFFLRGNEKNNGGIGCKINIETPDGKKQVQHFNPNKGFLSMHEQAVHFGIGGNLAANVVVTWPNGASQSIDNVAANKVHILDFGNAKNDKKPEPVNTKKLFRDVTKSCGVDFTPPEEKYVDYKLEPLLPRQYSQLGPCIAVGDVNADALEDFFVGGSANNEGIIFIQKMDGTFAQSKHACFAADKKYEDGAAEFFDADADGDKDLLVVSGSNEFVGKPSMYPVRLYTNDGKGNFVKSSNSCENIFTSANAVATADYDKDGDVDVFIGGRIVPGHYGLIPKSILLKNTNGKFKDISNENATLQNAGMVTSSLFSDVNGDSYLDLVLVGEWMPLTIYFNEKGVLKSIPTVYPNTNGWWNTILDVDIDGDKDMDLVAGNLGVNSRYKGDPKHPVNMLVNDFDKNGSTDCVISLYQDASYKTHHPIALRDNLLDQMVFLKKKYLRYKDYSNQTVEEIFTPAQMEGSINYFANNMVSTLFVNDGSANFSMQALGVRAQIAPVNGIVAKDFNDDGKIDFVIAGNNFESELESGRDDAGIGLFLSNITGTRFKTQVLQESGFYAPGNVKVMKAIRIQNRQCVIIGKNNEPLQIIAVQ
jgi:enediyne biosynthesis protein E4